MTKDISFPLLTAEEAAAMIPDRATVGFSGFTPAGAAKAVPLALAKRARQLHAEGKPFQLRVMTGASTGANLDEALAQADAISWRTPYQSSKTLRRQINEGKTSFLDQHLSHMPQIVKYGFLGELNWAVVEATKITSDGRIFLTTSIGASPTFLEQAGKIIVEVNHYHSERLAEMIDIFFLPPPPHRQPIPISDVMSKIGTPYVQVDPAKIVGVVNTEVADDVAPFDAPNAVSQKIAGHVVEFLLREWKEGRIPPEFLPLQAGVGNIANAVLAGLGENPDVPCFQMYTEVFQNSCACLMETGKLTGCSATSLTITEDLLRKIYDNMDFFAPRIVLRPQELANNPGVVRRLGVIGMNTAIEADIYGHVNSTHISGTQLMNGIGGSGDFTRNTYLSIFMAPSVAKGGRISSIVPMATHVDHSEHSVSVLVTEHGLADLRGLCPTDRARLIIDRCAHPAYRDYLYRYIEQSPQGHIRHDLNTCFELHTNLMKTGAMLPDLDLSQFA